MGENLKQVTRIIVLLLCCFLVTYSIRFDIHYGKFYGVLPFYEQMFDWVGNIARLVIPLVFGVIFFRGANDLVRKYSEEMKLTRADKGLIYIFLIWTFGMGVYIFSALPLLR